MYKAEGYGKGSRKSEQQVFDKESAASCPHILTWIHNVSLASPYWRVIFCLVTHYLLLAYTALST